MVPGVMMDAPSTLCMCVSVCVRERAIRVFDGTDDANPSNVSSLSETEKVPLIELQ